jgi:D-alanine-D-alanine ligase
VGQLAVLFGGPSPEHDVSVLTGLQALHELLAQGQDPLGIYWTKLGTFVQVDPRLEASDFLEGAPRDATSLRLAVAEQGGFVVETGRRRGERPLDVEAAILCTHGGPGEDGALQGALDLAGVAYSGPSAAGAALGMDKLAFGAVMAVAGLPTLPRVPLTASTDAVGFAGPYIVKPRFGGSSIGIDVVADLEVARARLATNGHLAAGAVIEPYRPDLVDLQIAVRSWPELELSAIERPLRNPSGGGEILAYADKYVGGEGMASAPRELPAALSEERAATIRELAGRVAEASLLRGVARIDFLASDDELYVNEINTIPGSLARYLFIDPPVPFARLLADLVEEAKRSPARRYSAAGADGLVLRGAASIAAKLA